MKLEFTSRVKSPDGPCPLQPISFSGEFCIIGRTEGNLLLSEARCSKRHCVIFQAHDGKLMLKDFESTNGTFLNGKRCEEAEVKVGDELRIGKTILTLTKYQPIDLVVPPLPQNRTMTATKTQAGTPAQPVITVEEETEQTKSGEIVRGWPHGYTAMPKEKAGKFIEYVDSEGTRNSISLEELAKKKIG